MPIEKIAPKDIKDYKKKFSNFVDIPNDIIDMLAKNEAYMTSVTDTDGNIISFKIFRKKDDVLLFFDDIAGRIGDQEKSLI